MTNGHPSFLVTTFKVRLVKDLPHPRVRRANERRFDLRHAFIASIAENVLEESGPDPVTLVRVFDQERGLATAFVRVYPDSLRGRKNRLPSNEKSIRLEA